MAGPEKKKETRIRLDTERKRGREEERKRGREEEREREREQGQK